MVKLFQVYIIIWEWKIVQTPTIILRKQKTGVNLGINIKIQGMECSIPFYKKNPEFVFSTNPG